MLDLPQVADRSAPAGGPGSWQRAGPGGRARGRRQITMTAAPAIRTPSWVRSGMPAAYVAAVAATERVVAPSTSGRLTASRPSTTTSKTERERPGAVGSDTPATLAARRSRRGGAAERCSPSSSCSCTPCWPPGHPLAVHRLGRRGRAGGRRAGLLLPGVVAGSVGRGTPRCSRRSSGSAFGGCRSRWWTRCRWPSRPSDLPESWLVSSCLVRLRALAAVKRSRCRRRRLVSPAVALVRSGLTRRSALPAAQPW